jgi:hypothetical protein
MDWIATRKKINESWYLDDTGSIVGRCETKLGKSISLISNYVQ